MTTAPAQGQDLQARVAALTVRDRARLSRRLQGRQDPARAASLERDLAAAEERLARRQAAVPARIDFPEDLPVSERRDDIAAAIRDHQVVVIAGETGSGKTTQIPKICLELGRGVHGLIGHTQPRRLAARSVAERIAEELGTPLGSTVGYTVRFHDQVGEDTLVKLMTDGVLLAEMQRDRDLSAYDTIIIDEAHERSLNIDFLLGLLKQLLARRPDLKLVITSATIDPQRFADHFGGAPVLEVSGRSFPVEVRYRPVVDEDVDQVQAIVQAVGELSGEGPGDILVFLSGEREIRDTADALQGSVPEGTEVVPLFARLSAAEQHRVFAAHAGRRIVLATNVAETSLTVPGIRYVVDPGTARISRYSQRTKVQRLPIEAISQASATQRAGRCGRVAPGICIRLYEEEDLLARPDFTDPEILRTNLASVILQMTALGLGDVEAFPFVDPPDRRNVKDGVDLLVELGALDPARDDPRKRLTPVGRKLAQLPIDPRLGRMVLAADENGCVRDVLVIAAALSIQDPRERPQDRQQAAAESHSRFADETSDFLAYLNLWRYLQDSQKELSSSAFRRMCKKEFLNYLRVREWQDLFSQIRQIAGSIGIRSGTEHGHPDRVHQALLAGLLSHIGMRDGTSRDFRGAHGSRFAIGSGSAVAKKPPRWVMAAELVETNRLWARTVAAIQPQWAERVGPHLTKYSYDEPVWDPQSARAVTTERVSMFGLPIVSGRRIGWDRVDHDDARAMFVLHALVEDDWSTHHGFVAHNREVLREVRALEDRLRRVDLVDAGAVYRFYDERVGAEVVSGRHFDQWWKHARANDPELLTLTPEALLGPRAAEASEAHPDRWRQDDLDLALTYRFDPGAPDDGVTVHVPLAVLNRVRSDGFDWQVPGLRDELVAALVKTLPKDVRRDLQPVAASTAAAIERLEPARGALVDALAAALGEVAPVRIDGRAFDRSRVPAHLQIGFVVEDEQGREVARDRDLDALRRSLSGQVRAAIARLSPLTERRGIVEWDLGDLPAVVETSRDGLTVRGYPALVDDETSVSLRILSNPDLQARVMRGGVRRLLLLTAAPRRKAVESGLSGAGQLAVARSGRSLDDLVAQCVDASADRVVADHGDLPFTAEGFERLRRTAKHLLHEHAADALATAAAILALATSIELQLDRLIAPAVRPSADDARAQLERLVRPGFVRATGTRRLPDLLRYLQGIERRLDRLSEAIPRDRQRMREVHALEDRYRALLRTFDGGRAVPSEAIELGWALEEHRISVFAPAIGARGLASAPRIQRELARLGG